MIENHAAAAKPAALLAGTTKKGECLTSTITTKDGTQIYYSEDLKKFDVPTLIMQGDDDQIVPIAITALVSSKIVKCATLKVYPGLPHSMCSTHKDLINADLLAFIKGEKYHVAKS